MSNVLLCKINSINFFGNEMICSAEIGIIIIIIILKEAVL